MEKISLNNASNVSAANNIKNSKANLSVNLEKTSNISQNKQNVSFVAGQGAAGVAAEEPPQNIFKVSLILNNKKKKFEFALNFCCCCCFLKDAKWKQ